MAATTLTVTIKAIEEFGARRVSWGYVAAPSGSSYPSGGFGLTAAEMGLAGVDQVMLGGQNGVQAVYNYTSSTIQMYTAYNTEVSTASNMATDITALRWLAIGKK